MHHVRKGPPTNGGFPPSLSKPMALRDDFDQRTSTTSPGIAAAKHPIPNHGYFLPCHTPLYLLLICPLFPTQCATDRGQVRLYHDKILFPLGHLAFLPRKVSDATQWTSGDLQNADHSNCFFLAFIYQLTHLLFEQTGPVEPAYRLLGQAHYV